MFKTEHLLPSQTQTIWKHAVKKKDGRTDSIRMTTIENSLNQNHNHQLLFDE